MAEVIAFSFLGKISEYLVAPIGRQFGYVFCYNRNIEKMRRQAEELEAKRRGVQLSVDAANNICRVIGPDVELWLKNADEKKDEANSILSEKEKVGKGCLNEWCLNLKSRYWLSRKATKRTQEVIDLLAKGNFQTVSYSPPALGKVPTSVDEKKKTQLAEESQVEAASSAASVTDLAIASTSTGSSGGFESRLSIMRDIMEAVRDENIHTIGICGMGGVGKTTMVHEVAKRAREEHLFDEVVKTVVSQERDIKNIQLAIVDFLGLKLTDHSSLARASWLHKRLTQKGSNGKPKRILLILDDLWKKLDLKEVGIPFGDDHSGCKLVLTSRSRDVCIQMKADKFFSIPVLPEDEAWILFQNSLRTTNLYPVAREIVKECGGLPIAITTIAMVLAEKEENMWKYVHRQLNRSSLEGDSEAVYTVFKVSYDNLECKEVKDVFLLCCLFPEDFDIPIEDLARYGMGRRIFKNVYNPHEARQNAHAHVQLLKNLNLLLDSEEEECVKMHDLVRDFGISIASEGEFFIRFDKGLKEWPMEDICEQHTSISMQRGEMYELPNGLKCPNLKLLQMWGSNSRPFKFPERLDDVMEELQVLALRQMSIPSLPGSVERLSNLRTLSLCDCKLNEDVSRIGNIEKLEILSFEEEAGDDEESYASFAELKQLSNLVAIDIDIPYMFLPIDLNLKNLEKFKISVGNGEEIERIVGESQNTLFLLADEIAPLKCFLKALCRKTEFLLVAVRDLMNLCNEVEIKDLSILKVLLFESCDELVSVFNDGMNQSSNILSSSSVLIPPFGNLRDLRLRGCSKLKSVFSLSIARGLINLKRLGIFECSGIEEIFSKERGDDQDEKKAVVFLNLEGLYLEDLPNLVSFCKAAVDEVKFPQLKEMNLGGLPNLTSIYPEMKTSSSSDGHLAYASSSSSTNHPFFHQKVTLTNLKELDVRQMENMTTVFPENVIPQLQSLESVGVDNCISVEVVFDHQGSNLNEGHHQVFSQLKSINLRSLPKLTSVWKLCPHVIPDFRNLKSLSVSLCDSLRQLFTPSMAKTLARLEGLSVDSCEVLEAIVAAQEDEKEFTTEEAILFPQLTSLHLDTLPSLLTVLPKPYSFNWSSLKNVWVEEGMGHLLRRPDQISV